MARPRAARVRKSARWGDRLRSGVWGGKPSFRHLGDPFLLEFLDLTERSTRLRDLDVGLQLIDSLGASRVVLVWHFKADVKCRRKAFEFGDILGGELANYKGHCRLVTTDCLREQVEV